MDTERKQQLEQFIQVLGLKEFHNLLVLDQALTHSSYANENKASHGYYNERLGVPVPSLSQHARRGTL